jgi:hypothetical protein
VDFAAPEPAPEPGELPEELPAPVPDPDTLPLPLPLLPLLNTGTATVATGMVVVAPLTTTTEPVAGIKRVVPPTVTGGPPGARVVMPMMN